MSARDRRRFRARLRGAGAGGARRARWSATRRIAGAPIRRAFLAQTRLDLPTLRRSEDTFVDELFADAVKLGVPLMRAHFPRAFLDVNREPYELDPRMFDGRLPAFANTRSLRVAGGLGTIARVVGDSREIYDRRLPVDEALTPHRALLQALSPGAAAVVARRAARSTATRCCSTATPCLERERARRAAAGRRRARRPLRHELRARGDRGDRGGPARARLFGRCATSPMPGGFITEHYGDPAAGLHAVQIEINRALYMDEREYGSRSRLRSCASSTSARMVARLAQAPRRGLEPMRDAAECQQSSRKERGRFGCRSGPSLGRKRPRRAANNATPSRYRTAQYDTVRRNNCKEMAMHLTLLQRCRHCMAHNSLGCAPHQHAFWLGSRDADKSASHPPAPLPKPNAARYASSG